MLLRLVPREEERRASFRVIPEEGHDSTTIEHLVSLGLAFFSTGFAFDCPAGALPGSIAPEDNPAAWNSREGASAATGGGGIDGGPSYDDVTQPLPPGRNKNCAMF